MGRAVREKHAVVNQHQEQFQGRRVQVFSVEVTETSTTHFWRLVVDPNTRFILRAEWHADAGTGRFRHPSGIETIERLEYDVPVAEDRFGIPPPLGNATVGGGRRGFNALSRERTMSATISKRLLALYAAIIAAGLLGGVALGSSCDGNPCSGPDEEGCFGLGEFTAETCCVGGYCMQCWREWLVCPTLGKVLGGVGFCSNPGEPCK
jgi:hypothetical protein